MADNTNLIDQIRQVVREEIEPVRATQQEQGKQLAQLQTDVTTLKGTVNNLELNVEAFRTEQRQANEELLTHIIDGYDENAKRHGALEKRVDRIEKNLTLPPVK
jgi:predicted  nucleic acid-binding Zn-ribbon protein